VTSASGVAATKAVLHADLMVPKSPLVRRFQAVAAHAIHHVAYCTYIYLLNDATVLVAPSEASLLSINNL
jgi:hypothetical protein